MSATDLLIVGLGLTSALMWMWRRGRYAMERGGKPRGEFPDDPAFCAHSCAVAAAAVVPESPTPDEPPSTLTPEVKP